MKLLDGYFSLIGLTLNVFSVILLLSRLKEQKHDYQQRKIREKLDRFLSKYDVLICDGNPPYIDKQIYKDSSDIIAQKVIKSIKDGLDTYSISEYAENHRSIILTDKKMEELIFMKVVDKEK